MGWNMKKLAYVLFALFALNALPVLAEEQLPEIGAVDEAAVPPLDAPAPDEVSK